MVPEIRHYNRKVLGLRHDPTGLRRLRGRLPPKATPVVGEHREFASV